MDVPGRPQYDSFASQFERHASGSAYNAHYDRPAVFDLVGDVAGKKVLDAGCGPGLYAAEFVRRGATVTAFDESSEMVRLARGRLGPGVEVRRSSLAAPLPWLPDDSYDVALMALVLHHLDDRVSALREMWRVLGPGGALVVSTSHPTSDWLQRGGSYFALEAVEETWQQDWQVRYWRQPLQGWCAEFAEAGFVIERLIETTPAASMAETYPQDYARLSREPGFIAFRLLKAP